MTSPNLNPMLSGMTPMGSSVGGRVGLPDVAASTPAPPVPSGFELSVRGSQGTTMGNEGNGLLSTLALPQGLNPYSPFTWQISMGSTQPRRHDDALMGYDRSTSQLTQMTMAGAMSWLRDLAVAQGGNPGGDYDAIVHQLVASGYLAPTQARYGSFTTEVGNAFLRSAADVWNTNQTGGNGQLMTWGDHMQGLINARMAAGQIDANGNPVGSGGSGPQAPTRKDNYTNPDDVKAAINSAAENILGRKLNDSEVGHFQSLYHGMEAKANDQQWAQTMSQFDNQSSTPNTAPSYTAPPSAGAEAQNYLDNAGGALGQERENQLLGSYVGILRNMTGLGAGGISHAVN